MKQTDNPFEGLGIRYPQAKFGDGSVKQKAFFEYGSYEAGLIPFEDRIEILAGLVLSGYDLHKLVDNYLEDKDALDDDRRKSHIASTFKTYAGQFFFESETKDWKTAVINVLIGDENITSSEQMNEAINEFVEAVKMLILL